jgi:hypothetical protein
MYIDNSTSLLTNATIINNVAISGAFSAIAITNGGSAILRNSIVYYNIPATMSAGITYNYCLNESFTPPGAGNLSNTLLPNFVNPNPNGNYRLAISPMSPCIDVGHNPYNTTPQDLDGNVRIQHIAIDMGAYERSYPYISPAPPQEYGNNYFFNETKNNEYTLQMFPNPALKEQILNIQLINGDNEVYTQNINVRVFSIDGKCIYEQQYSNGNMQIEISHLVSGIYIMQVNTKEYTYKTNFSVY